MIIVGYAAALVMGTVLGLIGGGGSILTVPILVYLMGIEPKLATAYSLFIVGTSAAFGAWTYARRGLVDYRTGAVFAVPSFIGVYSVRKYVMPSLPDPIGAWGTFTLTQGSLILIAFGAIMLLAALSMIRKSPTTVTDSMASGQGRNYGLIAVEGIVVGAVTGFVGAGGGFLIIPALVVLARLEMKVAVATSLVIISVKSLFGFLGDVQTTPHLDWRLLGLFSLISVVGMFVGTALSPKIPSQRLKPAFGWFVLIMGVLMILKEALSA